MNELQPGEFEVARYGAWWANVRRTDVNLPGTKYPTLWWWSVGHDGAGVFTRGRKLTMDEAFDAALAELDKLTGAA